MSESAGHGAPVVRLEAVGKMYKIFPSRAGILLDAVGLARRGSYREFWALRGFDLELGRGERLGIIGRNGAGKSTVLKLITEAIHPTEGAIELGGQVHALLEAGGGLHPEFSGYDNVRASLEAMGLAPGAVEAAAAEIADFTELGRFLEQPFKTYSLGMQSRLAFAIATAVEPEILIVDEVLGAGDAYFFGKAIARMERLIESGAAVLIVSHALDQIIRFCDEALWLDRGRIVMRAESTEVVRAYERFTRELQDRRLRARNRKALLARYDAFEREGTTDHIEVRIVPAEDGHCDVSAVRLLRDGEPEDDVRVGDAQDADESQSAWVALDAGAWSRPEEGAGGHYFRTAGGGGGPVVFALWFFYPSSTYEVDVTYRSRTGAPLLRVIRGDGEPIDIDLPAAPEWRTERVVVARPSTGAVRRDGDGARDEPVRWPGEGSLRIEDVELLGEDGRERAVFSAGTPLTVRLAGRATRGGRHPLVPALTLYRADGILVSNHPGEELELQLSEGETFELELAFGPLNLGDGAYVFTPALYRRLTHVGESVLYDLLDRSHAFEVVGNQPFRNGVFTHASTWRLADGPRAATTDPTVDLAHPA